MCGLAGFSSVDLNLEILKEMSSVITHRGPNSKGYFYNENRNVGLTHKRLSILDLSDKANQPMTSHCGNFTIVYNGEVYNYKNISKKINRKWKTSSDTEVILEAFVEFGIDFIKELNGMFVIIIYDHVKNQIILARDRIGIKPLYYHLDSNGFTFASELKSIQRIHKLKINKEKISSYLHLGYFPKDDTFYQNTYKFPAGSYGIYSNNKLDIKSYWNIENHYYENINSNLESSKYQLDLLLNESVKKRLISDVPLGCFLSGGIDSSLITAIAQNNSYNTINTFSIGLKESKYNESIHAREVAKLLNSNHKEFILSENDALEIIDKIMLNFDQPFLDSSAIPTYMVSQEAKKHVSVCLSGDGGDELFMGYGSYNWIKRLNNPLTWALRKPLAFGLTQFGNFKQKRGAKVLNTSSNGLMSHVFSQEQYLYSKKEVSKILNFKHDFKEFNFQKTKRHLSPIENQSLFDIKNYLKDDLLVKVDMTSMLNSLEVRVPMLDHNVVEYAINLDEKLKFNKYGIQKFILKELLYEYLPRELFDRPKWGFAIPLEKWLKTDLKYLVEKYVNKEILNEIGIYNSDNILNIKNNFYNNKEPYNWNKLWSIIILNKFLIKEKL